MFIGLVALGAIVCAVMALRTARLLVSALWLACASALVAFLLYLLGAHEIAVVELSVGAGLVTILFVFAISVAGDEAMDIRTIVPRPLAIALVLLAAVAIGWFTLGQPGLTAPVAPTAGDAPLVNALWQQRGLDVLVQIVLIFGGVLGVVGLLTDTKARREAGGQRSEVRSQKSVAGRPEAEGRGQMVEEASI